MEGGREGLKKGEKGVWELGKWREKLKEIGGGRKSEVEVYIVKVGRQVYGSGSVD